MAPHLVRDIGLGLGLGLIPALQGVPNSPGGAIIPRGRSMAWGCYVSLDAKFPVTLECWDIAVFLNSLCDIT